MSSEEIEWKERRSEEDKKYTCGGKISRWFVCPRAL